MEFDGDPAGLQRIAAAGTFGTGNGEELAAPATSETGSHTPVRMPLGELRRRDVCPRALAAPLAARNVPAAPLTIIETG